MHLRLHSEKVPESGKEPEEKNRFKPVPIKIRQFEHDGMFKEYDREREVRLFKEALENFSLDKPMKYQNVSPERLREIKDAVYDKIIEMRKSAEIIEV